MVKSFGRISIFAAIFLMLSSCVAFLAVWSVGDALDYTPKIDADAFDATNVSALSFVVFDENSGVIFASKDADTAHPIASVTKLISASVFYGYNDSHATTSIKKSDVDADGNAGDLRVHEVYSYRELLYPLLLTSSNDAAAAMLRVHPSLLADMHAYTRSLGLQKTFFVDPSGLSQQNVSTAHELSVIALDLFHKQPYIFDITRLHQFIGSYTGWINNNPVSGQQDYLGGKHGYTPEANRTIIAFFDEPLASGQTRTIGYVLLGSDDLVKDVALLRAQVHKNVRLE